MEIVVTLGAYLSRLKSEEARKPESQRRDVPTIGELATAAGVHRVTVQKIASSTGRVNFHTLSEIITELKRRGFDPTEADIVQIREAA